MDGLPGMKIGLATSRVQGIKPIVKMVGPLAPKNGTAHIVYTKRQLSFIVLLSFVIGILTALYGIPLWKGLKGQIINIPRYVHDVRLARAL